MAGGIDSDRERFLEDLAISRDEGEERVRGDWGDDEGGERRRLVGSREEYHIRLEVEGDEAGDRESRITIEGCQVDRRRATDERERCGDNAGIHVGRGTFAAAVAILVIEDEACHRGEILGVVVDRGRLSRGLFRLGRAGSEGQDKR